jgi:hypothetical protein
MAGKTGVISDLSCGLILWPKECVGLMCARYPTRLLVAREAQIIALTHRALAQKFSDPAFMGIMAGCALDRIAHAWTGSRIELDHAREAIWIG